MERPIVDYYSRRLARDSKKYAKELKDKIEFTRALRDFDREIEKIIMPIIKWLNKKLNNL